MSRVKGLHAEIIKDSIKKCLTNKGYAFFEKGDLNLNIVGIRNNSSRADVFDDTILVTYKKDGQWVVDTYPATTEPGPGILRKPINKKGTAILVPDQYRATYKIDTHGGKRRYTALCQRHAKVAVWRDKNKNSKPDYVGPLSNGMFGINIHRHWGPDEREYTGSVSAGCQVFQSSKDFYEFMETCNNAADKWGNSFTYTLVMQDDIT